MDYSRRAARFASAHPQNEEILGWLRRQEAEEVLEPELPVIDPHHHLWDRRRDACKYRTIVYGLHEILEDLYDGHNVVGTVYCQSKCYRSCQGPAEARAVNEVEHAQGVFAACQAGLYGPEALADSCTRVCWGIIGEADLRHPSIEAVLDEMVRSRNFRGIRGNGPFDDSFRRGFRAMEKHGLVFDIWHPPGPGYVVGELPKLAALAKEFPKVTIVLNHLGGLVGPAMGGPEVESAWREELRDIAQCPNVVCKVGGIFMKVNGFRLHERPEPPSSVEVSELAYPWLSHAIDCFGTDRCMFESNFPADRDSVGYRTLWNALKRVAAKKGLSDSQKREIFHDTAARVYRLQGAGGRGADPAAKRARTA